MFCSVRFGLDDERFFNLSCQTAALRDFVSEKSLKQIRTDFAKTRELHAKQIAVLTKQISAHTKKLHMLQKRANAAGDHGAGAVAAAPVPGDGDGDGGGDEDGEEEVQRVTVAPRDNPETVSKWIEAAEGEIREREASIVAIEEAELKFETVEKVDLQDPVSKEIVNLSSFPTHMPASVCLPLRCSTELVGFTAEQEEVSLLFGSIPKVVRSAEVEEMIEFGVIGKVGR